MQLLGVPGCSLVVVGLSPRSPLLNAPGRPRTTNLRLRKPVLCPAELGATRGVSQCRGRFTQLRPSRRPPFHLGCPARVRNVNTQNVGGQPLPTPCTPTFDRCASSDRQQSNHEGGGAAMAHPVGLSLGLLPIRDLCRRCYSPHDVRLRPNDVNEQVGNHVEISTCCLPAGIGQDRCVLPEHQPSPK